MRRHHHKASTPTASNSRPFFNHQKYPTISRALRPWAEYGSSQLPPPLPPASSTNLDVQQRKCSWENAFESLPEDDKKLFRQYILPSSGRAHDMPDLLIKVVREKRLLCEQKRWRFDVNGCVFDLQDTADRVISWLDKIKAVGDVAVNVDPLQAGLPWAGIRLLLIATISERDLMGSLLVGLDQVFSLVSRCKVYELLYPYDSSIKESHEEFTRSLTSLYITILKYLATAIRVYEQNKISRTLKAFWSPNQLEESEKQFQLQLNDLDIDVQNCERHYSHHDRIVSSQAAQSLKDMLGSLEQLSYIKAQVHEVTAKLDDIWQVIEDKKRHKVLMWVSQIPYEDHHRTAADGRTEETGMWLLKNIKYQEWRRSEDSMILWLHGIPGAGKTKLISRVVDDFKGSSRQTFAYFYCNRNEGSRRKPQDILNSFIKQLSMSADKKKIHYAPVKAYEAKRKEAFSSQAFSFNETKGLLNEILSTYPRTTLILDALDESDERTRRDLLQYFNELIEGSKYLKIIISSRRDGDIKRQLEKKANISLEATDNEDDIAKFVEQRIQQKNWDYPISEELRSEIVQVLLDKSKGMFQWAALQVAEVLSLELEFDIRSRLGQLPDTLKEAYDEIFNKINRGKGSKSKIAVRAFQWVMHAREGPLSADVVLNAVFQDLNGRETILPSRGIEFVLDSCHNLLVLDQRGFVRFSHLSAQEYLEKHAWTAEDCHCNIAAVCASILCQPQSCTEPMTPTLRDLRYIRLSTRTILGYAISSWSYHVARGGDKVTSIEAVEEFIGSSNETSSSYRRWSSSYPPLVRFLTCSNPWFGICFLGLDNCFSKWWSPECDLEMVNKGGESLLLLSVMSRNARLVEKLLAKGVDVNRHLDDGIFGSALGCAASYNDQVIIQLLLGAGANVNIQVNTEMTWSPLLASIKLGDSYETVELLLNAGADVNAKTSHRLYGTALIAAVYKKNQDIIKLLLDAGADVNAKTLHGLYSTALIAAIFCHYHNIIELLLDAGADVNAKVPDGNLCTALIAAIFCGYQDTVELLLDAGADVNAKVSDGNFRTALGTAIFFGFQDIVELLLDAGAVDGRDQGIVQPRLDAGVDTDPEQGRVNFVPE